MNTVMAGWNYLYSKIGNGFLPAISQEEALLYLGYGEKTFHEQGFNPGDQQLIDWFHQLCQYKNVQGKAEIFWKKKGKHKRDYPDEEIWERTKQVLRSKNQALIYHCYFHYMSPVGYEISVKDPQNSHKLQNQLTNDDIEKYLIIGDSSLIDLYQPFIVTNFKNIIYDLSLEFPNATNVRVPSKGTFQRQGPEFNQGGSEYKGNRHSFIILSKANE